MSATSPSEVASATTHSSSSASSSSSSAQREVQQANIASSSSSSSMQRTPSQHAIQHRQPTGPAPAMFSWTPSSDLFRSLQKDEYHLAHWRGEINEFASSVLGSRASRFEPEVDLLARGTYYGCTSLLGRSTLGEEYCDLMQATPRQVYEEFEEQQRGARLNRRSASRNTLNESTAAASSSLAATSSSLSVAPTVPSLPPLPPPVYSWAVYTPFQLVSAPRRAALFACQVILPYAYEKAQQHARSLLFTVPPERDDGGYRLVEVDRNPWNDLVLRAKRMWNKILSFILRSDYTLMNQAARLHLALFYLFGRYLEVSKRALGIRYIQVRAFDVPRPGYQFFGILLLIQVCVGMGQTLRSYIESLSSPSHGGAGGQEELHPLPGLHVPSMVPPDVGASGLLALEEEHEEDDDDRRDRAPPDAASQSPVGQPNYGAHRSAANRQQHDETDEDDEDDTPNCTLCLCPRENTTATECGHLYCWSCISEACTNKPECPMCRQPCQLNTLLLLSHYK